MWFLLIPPVAVLLAFVWVALRSRPDRTSEAMITIEGYRRSMAALARPIPAQAPAGTGPAAGPLAARPATATGGAETGSGTADKSNNKAKEKEFVRKK